MRKKRKSPRETKQLRFWRGAQGDDYIARNAPLAEQLRARIALWKNILRAMAKDPPRRILEVGANVGNNLRVLGALTGAELHALEPNANARQRLVDDGVVPSGLAYDGTASAIPLADGDVDLAFTSGVLIHIHPRELLVACKEIHRVARRYVACVEYFSAKPEEIVYRGKKGLLFKRDFGGYWLDHFPDLETLDYGFAWKPATGLDNLTWWVFRKA